ncbi:replicative DNA helicase [Acinetobacter ursingii]|uniref:replicative DNA helicase n=1 Tax=Acinetobacter ursingii TaxID=108980 RepID=UPI003009579C
MSNLHSIQTEQGVIASLLTLSDGIDQFIERLTREHFSGKHQIIFDAIQVFHSRGEKADAILVWDEIKKNPMNLHYIDEKYLITLMQDAPTVITTLGDHVEKLHRLAVRRKFLDISTLMQGMARDFTTNLDDMLNKSQNLIAEIGDNKQSKELAFVNEFVARLYVDLEETRIARENGTYVDTGIKTGFIALDNKIGTLRRGNFVIIGARPSMGKTTFAQNIMSDMAINQDMVVQFHSCEMTTDEIRDRIVSGVGQIRLSNIKGKCLEDDDWNRLVNANKMLEHSKFAIDDTANASLSDIRRKARLLKAKFGRVDAIFVDYLQIMKSPIVTDNQVKAIGEISKGLKAIAKEFDCVVFALSQLSRNLENRPNKRPVNADLRESGQIEQDADVILFIYRDEIYNKESKDIGTAEIIVGKCRDGEVGTVRLGTDLARATFADLDPFYLASLQEVGGAA